MGISKHYGTIFGSSIIGTIFSIWLIVSASELLDYSWHFRPDPQFLIGVGSSTLFASLLGCLASNKRSKGSRAAYNIFGVIGLGLSTAYFIWAIDIGFFAWMGVILMMVMITGLSNSAIIE